MSHEHASRKTPRAPQRAPETRAASRPVSTRHESVQASPASSEALAGGPQAIGSQDARGQVTRSSYEPLRALLGGQEGAAIGSDAGGNALQLSPDGSASTPVQAKISRGSGWGAIMWSANGQEWWTQLQSLFDDQFMPEYTRIKSVIAAFGPLPSNLQLQWDAFTKTTALDTGSPVEYSKAKALIGTLTQQVKDLATFENAAKDWHSDLLVQQQVRMTTLSTTVGNLGQKVDYLTKWSNGALTSEHKSTRTQLKSAVGNLLSKFGGTKRVDDSTLTDLEQQTSTLEKAFKSAHQKAVVNESLEQEQQTQKLKQEQEEQLELDNAEKAKQAVITKMGVKYKSNATQILVSLLHYATLKEIDGLLDLADAGTLQTCLPSTTPSLLTDLLGLTSADHLKKLIPALGKGKGAYLKSLLTHVQAGGEGALLSLINSTASDQQGKLLTLLQCFPQGNASASDAEKLVKAPGASKLDPVIALLGRVGVGEAANLVIMLGKMDAAKLDFCLDPARGGHTATDLQIELVAGNPVWAGEAGGSPSYLKVKVGGKVGEMQKGALTDVTGKAHDTQAHGMPAANLGFYCSRTFGNHGGADTMLLPKKLNGGNLTYTEYDVRPYTSNPERGVNRVVIDNNGTVYYTSDHYASFRKV